MKFLFGLWTALDETLVRSYCVQTSLNWWQYVHLFFFTETMYEINTVGTPACVNYKFPRLLYIISKSLTMAIQSNSTRYMVELFFFFFSIRFNSFVYSRGKIWALNLEWVSYAMARQRLDARARARHVSSSSSPLFLFFECSSNMFWKIFVDVKKKEKIKMKENGVGDRRALPRIWFRHSVRLCRPLWMSLMDSPPIVVMWLKCVFSLISSAVTFEALSPEWLDDERRVVLQHSKLLLLGGGFFWLRDFMRVSLLIHATASSLRFDGHHPRQ